MNRDSTMKKSGTFPRLIKMLFRFNPTLLPIIIALILISAVISALPSIFQQKVVAVLEQAWSNGWDWAATRSQILHYVLVLGALYLCGLSITTLSNQLGAIYTQRVLDQFRKEIFTHMESLPIRYFDTHQRGDIMSHYTNDVDAMRQMVSQSFPQLLVSLITVLTILCIMMYYSVWLGLVIIGGAVLTIFLTRTIGGKSAHFFMAQQKFVGRTEGVIEEMINGQKVIKVFNHEQEAQAEFDEANNALCEAAFQANRYSNTLMPILNNVNYLVYVLVAVAGGLFLELGVPIALQDLLVSVSFLVLLAIVNSKGVIASAGMGVAEKLCMFIMLVPSAFGQSMSAFVAQNVGAGEHGRARRALYSSVAMSVAVGAVMAWAAFFHGDALSGLFARDGEIIAAGADYLKAYGIDCLLTPFLFCFIGFYSGYGKTVLVMVQGIIGAFCVRIPVAYFMSRRTGASLFHIGLATPCSTAVQITICLVALAVLRRSLAEGEKRPL